MASVELPHRASFSVAIAAYQAEFVVAEAVRSALAQSPPPHEVIVCDDGSDDATSDVVREFGDAVRLIRTPNGGEASAKNTCARAATGEFVAFLDADDVFLPGRLAALGALAAARPDLDVLTTDAYLTHRGRVLRRCYGEGFRFAHEEQRAAILDRNFVFGLAAVRRARLLDVGGFDEAIRFCADWELWIRLILDGSRVGLVESPLAEYRLAATTSSANRRAMCAGRVATLEKTAGRGDLSEVERRRLAERLGLERSELDWLTLRDAILERDPAVRDVARRVADAEGTTPRARAVARLAATTPVLARAALAARRRGRTTTVAGTRLPRGR